MSPEDAARLMEQKGTALRSAVARVVGREASLVGAGMVRALAAAGRDDTGATRQSIGHEVRIDGDVVEGEVGAYSAHARFVLHGRAPGRMPPDAPIREWARRKGPGEEFTFLIRRKIAERGTEGTDFVSGPLAEAAARLPGAVEEAVTAVLR